MTLGTPQKIPATTRYLNWPCAKCGEILVKPATYEVEEFLGNGESNGWFPMGTGCARKK